MNLPHFRGKRLIIQLITKIVAHACQAPPVAKSWIIILLPTYILLYIPTCLMGTNDAAKNLWQAFGLCSICLIAFVFHVLGRRSLITTLKQDAPLSFFVFLLLMQTFFYIPTYLMGTKDEAKDLWQAEGRLCTEILGGVLSIAAFPHLEFARMGVDWAYQILVRRVPSNTWKFRIILLFGLLVLWYMCHLFTEQIVRFIDYVAELMFT